MFRGLVFTTARVIAVQSIRGRPVVARKGLLSMVKENGAVSGKKAIFISW